MCQFGHSIKVIGNIGDLGGWNVEESLRLEWSEGHVWTGEIEVDSRMKRCVWGLCVCVHARIWVHSCLLGTQLTSFVHMYA